MIGLAERALLKMRRGNLALVFGEQIGWALWNDQEFYKGQLTYTTKNFTGLINAFAECVPSEVFYKAIQKDATKSQKMAAEAIQKLCSRTDIPLICVKNNEIRSIVGSVNNIKTIMDEQGWLTASEEASLALAVMEVARGRK